MTRAAVSLTLLGVLTAARLNGGTLPPNFQETAVFTGLTQPTVVRFAPDGRVFVAEKSGIIKVFPNLQTNTPTVFADIRANVFDFWDRGLLGMTIHPNFPATPYVYVLYALDRAPDGRVWNDNCPTPPGPTDDGCAVAGRLSRLVANGNVAGPEQVLIEDWCQQFPSHSMGSLMFGEDGALYVTGGEGANWNAVDYGQFGSTGPHAITPRNVCGDPPGGIGGAMTPPTAQGGALRSQSRQRPNGPIVLNGTVLRLDPQTGLAHSTNPLINHFDVNARRIIADGLRNPFRVAWRPGTTELWVGDVGWTAWEEINRFDVGQGVPNFGWPCYEGPQREPAFEATGLTICQNLYNTSGAVTAPVYSYSHGSNVVPGDNCPSPPGSAISGLAFHPANGPYPAAYRRALFFADYNRRCIWVMLPDGSGTPDPSQIQVFDTGLAGGAVALETGPGGHLYYVDIDLGRVVRIQYSGTNTPPTAAFTATPQSGLAPLTVNFDASASSDPEGQALTYDWDFNGDGNYGDASGVVTSYTFVNAGTYTVRLRVTDSALSNTTSVVISAGNTPPTATINSPSASDTWRVGDLITFSGGASDPQQGALPASALTWTLVMQHCPSACHEHVIQQFVGVASGTFNAPDHEFPAYLELRLRATDSGGLADTKSVALQPQTVVLSFNTSPTGLQLAVNSASAPAPFTRSVIVGSGNSVSAPSPQTLNGTTYTFSRWSDNGGQSHTLTAPSTATTYVATYTAQVQAPSLSISDISLPEGNSSTRPAVFTVVLSSPASQPVTFTWSTASGGSAKEGSDYLPVPTTSVTVPANQTSAQISVPIVGDTARERDETFSVRLIAATNATIAAGRASGRIVNDD